VTVASMLTTAITGILGPCASTIDSSTLENNEQILIYLVNHESSYNHKGDQCNIQVQSVVDCLNWQRCQELVLRVGTSLKESSYSQWPLSICDKQLS